MDQAVSDVNHFASILALTGNGIYWIGHAIGLALYYISQLIIRLLSLLISPVAFVLQPVFYLGAFVLNVLLLPIRAIQKFEVRLLRNNVLRPTV
jgi:hypothetical protein